MLPCLFQLFELLIAQELLAIRVVGPEGLKGHPNYRCCVLKPVILGGTEPKNENPEVEHNLGMGIGV